MSIEFHCPSCTKLIKAPDHAGGKHGKCPYCEYKVYIPMPPDPSEEIGIAPIDEAAEQRELERLRREEAALAAGLSREDALPPGGAGEPGVGKARPREVPGEVVDLGEAVERFVLAMHGSRLEDADAAVGLLKRAGGKARDYVQGALLDEIPPDFGGVPPALAKGFLKTLLGRLK